LSNHNFFFFVFLTPDLFLIIFLLPILFVAALNKKEENSKTFSFAILVFKSNLPNFNYDALCEDLENIIKSYENKDSGTCTCNMTESIANEKVLEFSSFLL
jgi:hypothetical protein